MIAKRRDVTHVPTAPATPTKGDLLVLCADKNWQSVLQAVLARHGALGIRELRGVEVKQFSIGHDSGIRAHGPRILAAEVVQFRHGMLVLDHHGSGFAGTASALQQQLEAQLLPDWQDRAAAIVVEPELETWIIGAGRHFATLLERPGFNAAAWWRENGYWATDAAKPADPKAAVEALLAAHRLKRSGAHYRQLASAASLNPESCVTASFQHFVATLRTWFAR